MLKLYNTLSREKEVFKPIEEGQVGMYNCGPTVYDFAHIGNLRAYIFADTLRRTLEWNGYSVRQIMNITDFGHLTSDGDTGEDKMMKGLKRENMPLTLVAMRELSTTYMHAFVEDLKTLNIEQPTSLPRASDHIPEQIDIIKGLEAKGFTYMTRDGIYFDTSKDIDYGKLGGLSDTDEQHTRIEKNTEKKQVQDFALWKFNNELGWDSPWGKGFPGWHLECSAMSMKYLGSHFDIHTGGIDHIPIHHNNEIAQSESFTGEPFVNYWLHNGFITIHKERMAKSTGGFITREDIEKKGFTPLAYRYLVLSAHYRSPLDFTWEALEAAQNALDKLYQRFEELDCHAGDLDNTYIQAFTDTINDDLGTPECLAILWKLIKDSSVSCEDKKSTLLAFDTVLGLNLDMPRIDIPEEIQTLVEKREQARKEKNWDASDTIREKIKQLGFTVKDTDSGPKILKLH